ncbi:MAG: hypothetical protein JWL90_88 [Chthoniobacteraceae bacterium]|nr:hypothetical protein [Chthoniobacteraceae bacterium]
MKLILSLFIVLFSSLSHAAEAVVPEVVARGFDEYQKHGSLAAFNAWLSGSAIESEDDLQDQVVRRMGKVQSVFGRMIGYEIIRAITLSFSTRRVYAVAKFEKGAAWMSFDCYKPGTEWIIPRLDFNTNANLVMPPNILGGQ